MAKYFAMIEGKQCGPYTLDELHEAGVRPDTYVWCKGMDDWRKADDVADICRYYRQRLFDRMHPTVTDVSDSQSSAHGARREEDHENIRGIRSYPFPMPEESPEELQTPPMPTLGVAIAVLLFCFPLTGIMAVYYSVAARKEWDMAMKISRGEIEGDADSFRKKSHNSVRLAKMWIGITFFIGLIFYSFMVSIAG